MPRKADAGKQQEGDGYHGPSCSEQQKAPGIGDDQIVCEVAKIRVFLDKMAVEGLDGWVIELEVCH